MVEKARSPLWVDSLTFWGSRKCLGGPKVSSKSPLPPQPLHTALPPLPPYQKPGLYVSLPSLSRKGYLFSHIPHNTKQEGSGSTSFPSSLHTSSYGRMCSFEAPHTQPYQPLSWSLPPTSLLATPALAEDFGPGITIFSNPSQQLVLGLGSLSDAVNARIMWAP